MRPAPADSPYINVCNHGIPIDDDCADCEKEEEYEDTDT